MTPKALIDGITGQDGSYLAEFLLEKGYEVHGIVRPASIVNRGRIHHLTHVDAHNRMQRNIPLFLHYGDVTNSSSLTRILNMVQPDEVYHLAAQSHVKISFDVPEYTSETTAFGTLRMLESIRELGLKCKFYQAGSSEMFGKASESPQKETTPFYPRSPYAVAKVYAHWIAVNYREAYDLFICNGILFNHESPRRGENFVTRKISLGVAAIKLGLQDHLRLGNLEAKRDWGYAKDYVEAMWLLLQQETPDDYVIATGQSHSVREFCESAFGYVGLDYRDFVIEDATYFRPLEVDNLVGDYAKARERLGWEPRTCFEELVRIMVDADIELLKRNNQLDQAQYILSSQVA